MENAEYQGDSGLDLTNVSIGDYVTFGRFEQDGNEGNGAEPVDWIVLAVEDDKVLLISRYVLDGQEFGSYDDITTWETSSLRSWLNNEFLNNAFTKEEQKIIKTETIHNIENPEFKLQDGKDTEDKIFCLSCDEVFKYYSPLTTAVEPASISSEYLISAPTAYAREKGLYVETITEERYENRYKEIGYSRDSVGLEGTDWYLRSTPKDSYGSACVVDMWGNLSVYSSQSGCFGVRPALYLHTN